MNATLIWYILLSMCELIIHSFAWSVKNWKTVTVHFICMGYLRLGEMRSTLRWECYLVVSQHQRALHQCVQRNCFWLILVIIASKWVMSWICYTLLTFCDWSQQLKVITFVSCGCHVSFEFTCEILINKFEIHIFHIHLWDLIKHLAIPLYINISIWS